MEPQGKVAIVTGGAAGIGRAIAHALVRAGAKVCVLDLHQGDVQRVVEELNKVEPGAGIGLFGSASDAETIQRALSAAEEAFGPVDLYCANAGIASPGISFDESEWRTALDVNLLAHIRAANLLIPRWKARGQGYFLTTASSAALTSQLGDAAYAVSKHAALAFAEWLSISFHEFGVRASCLCPMGVQTNMLADLLDTREFDYRQSVGRVLSAEDVAEAVMEGLRKESFLITPQPEVLSYFRQKGEDYDRWLGGMRRLQSKIRRQEAH